MKSREEILDCLCGQLEKVFERSVTKAILKNNFKDFFDVLDNATLQELYCYISGEDELPLIPDKFLLEDALKELMSSKKEVSRLKSENSMLSQRLTSLGKKLDKSQDIILREEKKKISQEEILNIRREDEYKKLKEKLKHSEETVESLRKSVNQLLSQRVSD